MQSAGAFASSCILQCPLVHGPSHLSRRLMKYRYGKFVPDLLDELDMDELMSKLSDLLLASGFGDPYLSGTDDEKTMQALYDAILDALLSGGVLPDDRLQELLGEDGDEASQAAARAADQADHGADAGVRLHHRAAGPAGQPGPPRAKARARSPSPRRRRGSRSPTRRSTFSASARCATCSARSARAVSAATTPAIWPPASRRRGATKPYEFGDTLNLDASATLLNAVRRRPGRHGGEFAQSQPDAGPRIWISSTRTWSSRRASIRARARR